MAFDEEELDPHGECAAEIANLRAEIERLRAALKDTKHFFLGHFDDNCEECRRGLGVIDAALSPERDRRRRRNEPT